MKFKKFVKFDCKHGIGKQWSKYVGAIVLFTIFSLSLFSSYLSTPAASRKLSLGDYLFNIWAGMSEYVPSPDNPIRIPALWMLMLLWMFYLTLYYPYHNLTGIGKQLLIVSGNRYSWWFSKCIWIILCVLTYYSIGFAVTLMWTIFSGGILDLTVSKYVLDFLKINQSNMPLGPYRLNVGTLLLPILVTTAICMIQLILSVLIRPIFSYLITVAYLFLSVYFQNSFFIGNYMMAARNTSFSLSGMTPWHGAVIAVFVIIVSIVGGSAIFNKIDIIDRE